MVVVLIFYPAKWIDHKIEERNRRKVERKFGKADKEDENTLIVETMGSSFVK